MNLYNAIMSAAGHIEQNPKEYNFDTLSIPTHCGSPGCALGWIAHFAGVENWADKIQSHEDEVTSFVRLVMKVPPTPYPVPMRGIRPPEGTFYERLDQLRDAGDKSWIDHPEVTAKVLRRYAEKYHAHEKQRPTQALVADLMTKVMGAPIAEDA